MARVRIGIATIKLYADGPYMAETAEEFDKRNQKAVDLFKAVLNEWAEPGINDELKSLYGNYSITIED